MKWWLRKSLLVLAALTAVSLSAVAAQEKQATPTAADFKAQIARLERKDKDERLAALGWIHRQTRSKHAELAMPALERCIRSDPDADVRRQAVANLGSIALHLKQACPLAIVEAMLDKDEVVSQEADAWAGLCKTYAPGSIEVLLRCARSENEKLRGDCLLHLARAGGKDKKVLDAIENAKKDKSFGARHNAHIAMFHATDNLEQLLVYYIRLRDDPDSFLRPVAKDAEAAKRERTTRNLAMIGGALVKVDWSEHRAADFAPALMKLLNDPSPALRRGAAQDIGATAGRINPASFEPYLKDGKFPESKEPPQKSKVALALVKLKAADRLRELRDNDPDETVRLAARAALERWSKAP